MAVCYDQRQDNQDHQQIHNNDNADDEPVGLFQRLKYLNIIIAVVNRFDESQLPEECIRVRLRIKKQRIGKRFSRPWLI